MSWLSSTFSSPNTWSSLAGLAGSIYGNSRQNQDFNAAAAMGGPHGVTGAFGSSTVGPNGAMSFNLDPQSQQFGSLAQAMGFGTLGSYRTDPLGNLTPDQLSGANGYGQLLQSQQGQYSALGRQLFDAINSAGGDPSQIANARYQMLTQQAQPGIDQRATALQNSLFERGRLGTTGGALDLQANATSEGNADVGRQIDAANYAQQWQQQMYGLYGQANNGAAGAAGNRYALANQLLGSGLNTQGALLGNAQAGQGLYGSTFAPLFQAQAMNQGNPDGADMMRKRAIQQSGFYSGMFGQLLPLLSKGWGTA